MSELEKEKNKEKPKTYYQPTAESLRRDEELLKSPSNWEYICFSYREDNNPKMD